MTDSNVLTRCSGAETREIGRQFRQAFSLISLNGLIRFQISALA